MLGSLRLVECSGGTRTIRIGATALSSGADSAIYRIEGEPGLVAKIYHEPGKDPEPKKIQAMLADPPDPARHGGYRSFMRQC